MKVKLHIFLLIIGLLILVTGCFSAESTSSSIGESTSQSGLSGIVPIYTPPSGGTNYIIGAGIGKVFKDLSIMPEVELVAESTSGTVEAASFLLERYREGKPALGVLSAETIDQIYNGNLSKIEGQHPELRGIAYINYTAMHIIVRDDSDIYSLADLKGKRVGIPSPPETSAHSYITLLLKEGYGLSSEDYKGIVMDHPQVKDELQNGSIDAGLLVGAIPFSLVQELAAVQDIRLLPVEDEILEEFTTKHPSYSTITVEAGTYPGLNEDIALGTFQAILVTHEDVPDELAYNLAKMIIEQQEELRKIYQTVDITKENVLLGINIPLHPGAEQYYKEIGLLTD